MSSEPTHLTSPVVCCRRLVAGALGAFLTALAPASAAPLAAHPVALAVGRGDCNAAVDLINRGAATGDGQALFLGGRMLDEGICLDLDRASAAKYFARAAILGQEHAALEYAADLGLGLGAAQSYERAGEICRSAGLDPQARLSLYSLGYACTVRAVAGRLVRQRLPRDALPASAETAMVEFRPASAQMRILALPPVAVEPYARVGSIVRRPRVNAQLLIEEAWRNALAAVPKPDAAHLDDQPVELSLDVETALRDGAETADGDRVLASKVLLWGEVIPTRGSPSLGN
jgi:hypothetical protein